MTAPTRARKSPETRPAMRNAIFALTAMPNASEGDLRVGLVVLELTAGHDKLRDAVSRGEIARRANVSERTATRSLAKLEAAGIVEWKPARARGQLGSLRLRRAGEASLVVPPSTRDTYLS